MTVLENLQIAATSVPLRDDKARINRIFQDYPDLFTRKSLKAGSLSDGMQQQLALAMAMSIPFQVLLLDEPSHGLDNKSMSQFGTLFMELAKNGTCILMTEQNMDFVEEIASKKYWLEEGKAKIVN
jgi:branched-chain amino acid transport system ATP-binding protein